MVLLTIASHKLNNFMFTILIFSIRCYWDLRSKGNKELAIKQVLEQFEDYLFKSRPKVRNRLGIRRERAGTLMPRTIEGYCRVLRKVMRDLNTVCPTLAQADEWLIGLQKRSFSYNHCANSASALEWLFRFNNIEYRGARPQKKTGDIKHVLTEEEINLLYKGCRSLRDRALLSAFAFSGCRCEEIGFVKVGDIDFEKKTLYVSHGKGAKTRWVSVADVALTDIKAYIDESKKALTSCYLDLVLRVNEKLLSA